MLLTPYNYLGVCYSRAETVSRQADLSMISALNGLL